MPGLQPVAIILFAQVYIVDSTREIQARVEVGNIIPGEGWLFGGGGGDALLAGFAPEANEEQMVALYIGLFAWNSRIVYFFSFPYPLLTYTTQAEHRADHSSA